MPKDFTVFADNQKIYEGPLDEIPEYLRNNFIEAIVEWGDCLSKSGLNELVYSSLHWYNEKTFHCAGCDVSHEEEGDCSKCGETLDEYFIHERNPEIDRILDCIGMINRVDVTERGS